MTDLLEWKALFILTVEDCPFFIDPCVIYYTYKEHKKIQEMIETR